MNNEIAPTPDLDKCIICLESESSTNKLTDEHVIPEFMGGIFFLKNVCKTCNSNMGKSFEGRLSNHIIFIYNREDNNIAGKNDNIKNPLSGAYRAEDGSKYLLDENLNINIPQKFNLTEIEGDIHSLVYTKLSEESLESNLVIEEIKKYALAKLKKKDPKIEKIEITLESEDTSEIGKLTLEKTFKLSEEDLKLLALKICYEMYIYVLCKSNKKVLLEECLSKKNVKFHKIRGFLKQCKINLNESNNIIRFLDKKNEDNLLKAFTLVSKDNEINVDNRYVICFGPSFCIVKFLCFSFMINADFSLALLSSIYNPLNNDLSLQTLNRKRHLEKKFFETEKVIIVNKNQAINFDIIKRYIY